MPLSFKKNIFHPLSSFGKNPYGLHTTERSTGKQRLNPNLTKEIKTAAGPRREELMVQKDKDI